MENIAARRERRLDARGGEALPYGWMANARLFVALLLVAAAWLDKITGPLVTITIFYVLPVVLAGWQDGWKKGALAALAATTLHVATEWKLDPHPLPITMRVLNEALLLVALFMVVALTEAIRRHQALVADQRDDLARLNTRMENEMVAARTLQKALAGSRPTHPALDMADYLKPARILCGDTLHTSIGKGKLAVALADVCGKGSPAALAGAVLIGLLEDAPARYTSPAKTLSYLNERLSGCLPREMFITAFYALLDLETGELTYANAGHERPYLLPARAMDAEIAGGGFPLGMFAAAEYEDAILTLHAGDAVFIYSDGLPDHELPTGERVGRERLAAELDDVSRLPCSELVSTLLRRTVGEDPSSADDITAIAIRYLGMGVSLPPSAVRYQPGLPG